MRLTPFILVLAGLATCEKEPDIPPAEPGTPGFVAAQRAVCEAQGGNLTSPAPGKPLICVRTTRDANKQCTTSNDCEGQCLARSRTCAPITPLFGCYAVVASNGAVNEVCVE